MATTTVTYLLPTLRLHLGDISTPYQYLDEWVELSLVTSVETLQRWWNYKYLVSDTDEVYRNPKSTVFLFPEPPVIQNSDERPIILMAGIIIKKGDLQNLSWNVGAWRDAEISYSNIEGSRGKQKGLQDDWDELTSLLTPPTKKLGYSKKQDLPGYKYNPYEYD